MRSKTHPVFLATLALAGLALAGRPVVASAASPAIQGNPKAASTSDGNIIAVLGSLILELDGIQGESIQRGHEGGMDLVGFSWGAERSGAHASGGGGGAGKVSVHDISITKFVDKASPELMLRCANGQHIKEAVITMRKAGGTQQEYLVVTLKDVMITSYSLRSGDGDARPMEEVSLNFTTFEMDYTEEKPDGTSQEHHMGWDLGKNKPI
jgi:type VI secretion system secreted protein Hcp